jgi:hypothetical protein
MTTMDAQAQELSFQEATAIADLAKQAGPTTKTFFLGQAQTWLNAFRLFRDLENRIGHPVGEREKQCYFALLSLLLTSGAYISEKLNPKERLLDQFTGVSKEAFEGCVELLKDSFSRLTRGYTSEQLTKIRSDVFDGEAAA